MMYDTSLWLDQSSDKLCYSCQFLDVLLTFVVSSLYLSRQILLYFVLLKVFLCNRVDSCLPLSTIFCL